MRVFNRAAEAKAEDARDLKNARRALKITTELKELLGTDDYLDDLSDVLSKFIEISKPGRKFGRSIGRKKTRVTGFGKKESVIIPGEINRADIEEAEVLWDPSKDIEDALECLEVIQDKYHAKPGMYIDEWNGKYKVSNTIINSLKNVVNIFRKNTSLATLIFSLNSIVHNLTNDHGMIGEDTYKLTEKADKELLKLRKEIKIYM